MANEFEAEVNSRGEELKALATAKKIVIEATSLAQTSLLHISSRSDLISCEAVRYIRDYFSFEGRSLGIVMSVENGLDIVQMMLK